MPFQIIPYNAMYHDLVYEICLKTGNSGAGAEHIHNDPMVLGHIYAGPYINLEPESAFLLEDEMGVCGYIMGALDTLSFFNKVKSDWLPKLQKQYSDPTESSKPWNKDEKCIHFAVRSVGCELCVFGARVHTLRVLSQPIHTS